MATEHEHYVVERQLGLAARFEQQSLARSQERAKRLAAEAADRDPQESTTLFLDSFTPEVARVREGLAATVGIVANPGGADPNAVVNTHLDGLLKRVMDLQATTAAATIFLSPYDLRSAQETVRVLRTEISDCRAQHAPRPKFRFRRSRAAAEAQQADGGRAGEAGGAGGQEAGEEKEVTISEARKKPIRFRAQEHLISDVQGGTVVVRPGQLPAGTDVVLSNISDCVVSLLGHIGALRCSQLKNCKVYVGPIAGSAHVEGLENCVVALATRQLRMHYATNCDIYLHACSNPIIEDCSGLRFAPYSLRYPELDGLMQAAGIKGMANLWDQVNDFKWHRQQHSPNWAVLEESERTTECLSEYASMGPEGDGDSSEDEI